MATFFILSHPWQENSHSNGDLFQKCLLGEKKMPSTFKKEDNGSRWALESQNLRWTHELEIILPAPLLLLRSD